MTILIYDGSYEGMLSAVFHAFKTRLDDICIQKKEDYHPDLFTPNLVIVSDREQAFRVMEGIKTKISKQALSDVLHASLVPDTGIETAIFRYLRYGFREKRDISADLAVPEVLKVADCAHRVRREAHRMTGFLRFQMLLDGTFFAEIAPDNNILPLLGGHFKDRFADQEWIIQDARRGTALIHRDGRMEAVSFLCLKGDIPLEDILDPEEPLYAAIWRRYCRQIAIEDRLNSRLQMQFLPKKYWQYLTEMA